MTVPTELTPRAIAGAIARLQPEIVPLPRTRTARAPAVAAAPSVVVELVGPAGAGKSTVRGLVASMLADGRTVARPERRWLRTAALAVGHAPAWLAAAAALRRVPRGEAREYLRHVVRVRTLRAELPRLRADAGPALVLDEGPVFSLVRLHGACDAAGEALARYVAEQTAAWAGCLHLVVWLDAPDEVLTRRIREREKAHRMKHRSDDDVRRFLRADRRSFTHVVGALGALGVQVAQIDTSAGSATAVAERVRALAAGGQRVC